LPGERLRRSRCLREPALAHPRGVFPRAATEVEPVLRSRAVAGDDTAELVPVRLSVLPHALVVLAQLRIRNREPELPDLRDVAVEELLPRLFVALRLDPPDVHRVLVLCD